MQNLVHIAASEGRGAFLAAALLYSRQREDVVGERDKGESETRKLQQLAFQAATGRDSFGRSPLALAIGAESIPVVKVLLDCYGLLMSQDYALPFSEKNSPVEEHPSELFPLDDFCDVVELFPSLALDFVTKLKFVTCGDRVVQEGVVRYDLGVGNRIVLGSHRRTPPGFWKKNLSKIKEEGGESEQLEGVPVVAKLVSLKGIATRDSKFLRSITNAADKSGKFTGGSGHLTVEAATYITEFLTLYFFHRSFRERGRAGCHQTQMEETREEHVCEEFAS